MNGLKGPIIGFKPFEDEEDRRFVPVPEAVKTDLPGGPILGFKPFEKEEIAPPGEMAPEQVRGLKPAKREGGVISRSFKRGQFMVELSRLQTQQKATIKSGQERDPEIDKRIEEIKRLTPDPRELKEEDLLTQMGGYTAEQIPIMGEVIKGGLEEGMRYAIIGGMAGAAVKGVGAAPGFALGGKLGMMYGASRNAYILEGGLAFDEYLELKDEKGNKIDPLLAARAADIVGVINAALEMAQVNVILKTIPGGRKLLRWGINKAAKKALKHALKRRSVKQILATGAKTFTAALGTEVGQEVLQEVTNIVGEETIKEITNTVDSAEFKLAREDKEVLKEQINRIGAVGLQTLKAMPALVGPGVTVTTATQLAGRKKVTPPPTDEPTDLLGIDSADKAIFKDIESALKEGAIPPEEYPNIIAELRERGLGSTKELQKLEELFKAQAQIEPIDLTKVVKEGAIPLEEVIERPPIAPEEAMFVEPEEEAVIEEELPSEEGVVVPPVKEEVEEVGVPIKPEEKKPPTVEETLQEVIDQPIRNVFDARNTFVARVRQKLALTDEQTHELFLRQEYIDSLPKIDQAFKDGEDIVAMADSFADLLAEKIRGLGRKEIEPAKPIPEAEEVKEPWEPWKMTWDEYYWEGMGEWTKKDHISAIKQAISEGKIISHPDYPELGKVEPTTQEIDQAAEEAETEPTEAQKEAGVYKKGHIKLYGYDISIENPKGSMRSGVDRQGKKWSQKLKHHYGYIRGTKGKDKDHLDVFIGPNPESDKIFVVDQVDPRTGKFDEHKIMMGFPTVQQARVGYLANYERAWKGLGEITELTVDEFKEWTEGDTTKAIKVKAKVAPEKPKVEKKKPTPEEAKPIPGITYKTKIKVEETGEIVEVTMDAEQAIKDIDKKIEAYKKLIHCLR